MRSLPGAFRTPLSQVERLRRHACSRGPVATGSSAACHARGSCRTCLSFCSGLPNTPSADFCLMIRWPFDHPSRRGDMRQISRGKFSRLPCATAESTPCVLDGYGLRGTLPARPTLAPCIRFLSINSHVCSTLPSDPASRRQPLRIAYPSPPSGWVEVLHLQMTEHARHTTKLLSRCERRGRVIGLLSERIGCCSPLPDRRFPDDPDEPSAPPHDRGHDRPQSFASDATILHQRCFEAHK